MTETVLLNKLDEVNLKLFNANQELGKERKHYNSILKLYQKQLVKCKEYQDYIDSKEIAPTLRVGTRWVQNGVYVV